MMATFYAAARRGVARPLGVLAFLLISFSGWAQATDGVLGPATLAVCSGLNTGTLTLSGNTGAVLKFQANSGSGFVDLANSALLSYTFNNLTQTTTYRAVTQNGNSAPATVTVNQPPTATINSSGPTTFCQRGTIFLVAGPGGTGYTYQFLLGGRDINGATSQTYTTTVTSNGNYSVRVTDANGCSSVSSALQIRVNALSVVNLTAGGTTACQGGSIPLTATTSGAGSGNYTYQYYLNGTIIQGAVSPTYAATQSGSYTVVVTNPSICTSTSNAVAITPTSAVTFSYPAAFYCQTTSLSTTPTVSPTGGTFAVTSGGTGLVVNPTTGVINAPLSRAGTYTVTYSSGGACPGTATATVQIRNAPTTAFSYPAAAPCAGQPGTLVPTLAPGSNSGTFTATPNGVSITPSTGVINVQASLPGTYTVLNSVSSNNGCAATSSAVTVVLSATPVAAITTSGPTTLCQGSSVVLTATGGAAGASYQFLNNGQAIAGATGASYTATAAGSYAVVVTNPSTCAATSATTAVVVNPLTTAAFSYPAAAFCQNATAPTPTVTGTAGGQFSAGTGLTINAATGSINLAQSTPGTYTVTYAVAGPCPSSATASVTVTAPATAGFAYAAPTYCTGGPNPTPTLTAGATAGVFAATPTGLVLNPATGTIDLSLSQPGTYIISNTVAASGGCPAATATATVAVGAQPTAALAANGPTTFCPGGSVTLTANGGIPGSTYQFLNNGQPIGGATAASYVAVAAGSYTVVITNAGLCTATSAPVAVAVNAVPTPTLNYAAASFCQGAGTAAATLSGGVSGGSFAAGTGLVLNATTGTLDLGLSQAGTYTVTYTSGGPCPGTATASVTLTAPPSAAFAYVGGATFCPTAANPTPTISGSAGGVFSAPAGLVINPGTGTLDLQASTAGTYAVTYALAGACPASSTLNVTITTAPTAAFAYGSASGYCAGSTGLAVPTFAGGSSAGTFSATPAGLRLNPGTGAIDLNLSQPGTYTVTNTIAASGACTAVSATALVTLNAAPTATLVAGGPTTFCQGGSVLLTAPAGTGNTYQFLLNGQPVTGATAATYTASAAGSYAVAVTNASGCAATSAATAVVVNPATTAAFSYPAASFCASGAGAVAPTVAGTAGGSFSASPAGLVLDASTGAITASTSPAGTYTVTYAVAGPCPSNRTTQVTITAPGAAGFSYAQTSYCPTGTATPALATGSTAGAFAATPAGLSLNASTGAVDLSLSQPGTYTVSNTLTAGGGCAAISASTTLTVNPTTTAAFSYSAASFCTSGTLAVPTVTGTAGGNFSASPTGLTLNASTGAITASSSPAGTYTVTYAVTGPCPSSSTTQVTITAPGVAGFSYAQASYCPTGTATAALATGSTAGVFAATPTGLSLNASTGAVDLSLSQPGTYTVSNALAAGGGCAAVSASTTLVVNPATTAAFAYPSPTLCASASAPALPTVTGTAGGSFSASPAGLTLDASTGAITANTSTVGAYTVTYAVAGPCPSSATVSISIATAPTAGFAYAQANYCPTGTATPTLPAGSTAGTFTATPTGLSLNASTGAIDFSLGQPGSYVVTNTVAASGGCAAATATASLTVNPAPAQPTLTNLNNTLTTPAVSGASYQYFLNGTAIVGATGPAFTPTQNGSYTVVVASAAGCASVASAAQVVIITAVRAAQVPPTLALYPNPTADGHLTLTLTLTGATQPTPLTVCNALGQEMLTGWLTNGPQAVDLSKLATGVYVLRAGSLVRRVVRE